MARLDLCSIKIMLAAVDQCVSQLTAVNASRRVKQPPQSFRQGPCEGVSTVIVTGQLQQVNGQMTAVHSCNGTLLIFNTLTPTKAWMNLKGIMIHHNNLKSILYIMAHSWCQHILQVWTNDKYLPLQYYIKYPHCPKNSLWSTYSSISPPPILDNHCLFTL